MNDSCYLKNLSVHSLGINDWNSSHIYLIYTLLTCSHLLRSQNWVPDCAYSYHCVRYQRLLKPYASTALSFGRRSILVCVKFSLFIRNFLSWYMDRRDTQWRSWLRHCATSRKVAGSIPDGVTGIFHWHNPSHRTMALRSTQPLTEISTRIIFWG